MHASAYPSPSNPAVSLPRLSILGHPPVTQPATKPRTVQPKETPTMGKPAPATVLFGLDDRGKAHAAWFTHDHAEAGAAAAEAMAIFALPVEDDAVRALAAQVPRGKIFASGKAFVPFVKASLFDALVMHLPEDQRDQARQPVRASGKATGNSYAVASGAVDGGGSAPAGALHDLPDDWSKIKVGSLVLASDGPGDGWYEADVIDVLSDAKFKLRWLEWPDLPDFVRAIADIALLHPQHNLD